MCAPNLAEFTTWWGLIICVDKNLRVGWQARQERLDYENEWSTSTVSVGSCTSIEEELII